MGLLGILGANLLAIAVILAGVYYGVLAIIEHLRIPTSDEMIEEYTKLVIYLEKAASGSTLRHQSAKSCISSFLEESKTAQWKRLKKARLGAEEFRTKDRNKAIAEELLIKYDPERMAAKVAELEAELKAELKETQKEIPVIRPKKKVYPVAVKLLQQVRVSRR